jgi:glyoxylase-like metal-dependent hydrolase (beta-lactamase superfamily II)
MRPHWLTVRRALTVLALAATPLLAQQPVVRTADPVKRGFKDGDIPRVVKVTANVYTYEDFHSGAEKFTTTNMFVVTSDGVLLADAQGSVAATKSLVDAIAKVTPTPITDVVIASDHGDHTGGNAALPAGVRFFIHPTSQAILKGPAGAQLVSDRRTLTRGGEEIQILFLGRAHTGGDLSVYLPRQQILFLSETFLNRVFPAMRSAYPTEWLAAVDKALTMDVKIYIPGHGFTETGPVSREELIAFRGALAAVIKEATRLHNAGVPVADAVTQANWGDYASWTLASSQGPIAVRRVYDELDKKLK